MEMLVAIVLCQIDLIALMKDMAACVYHYVGI